VTGADGVTRAVSQAGTMPMVPDGSGERRAPGAAAGLPLADLVQQVQAARGGAR
jgi:hypothetical protein